MTPEQEARYALDFGVARSDLPEYSRLAYDRLVERRGGAAPAGYRGGVAGPERQQPAAGMASRGRLRASHADRAQVIETLKSAFVLGMLSKDEFDLRVGQTFASRTYGELAEVLADIPAGLTTAHAPAPGQGGGQPVARPGPVLAATSAAYAGVWAYLLLLSPHAGDYPWGPSLILASGLIYVGILLICVGAAVAVRRARHSGGGPPPRRIEAGKGGHSSPRQASADPGSRRPPDHHGPARSTDAARDRVSRPALHPRAGHA